MSSFEEGWRFHANVDADDPTCVCVHVRLPAGTLELAKCMVAEIGDTRGLEACGSFLEWASIVGESLKKAGR